MSTRCQIYIKGMEDIKIYKHSDGYPEESGSGVLCWLVPFLKDFKNKRGPDPQYLAAQIVYTIIDICRKTTSEIGKYFNNEISYDYTGCGLSTTFSPDIEFVYEIDAEKFTVNVFETNDKFWNNHESKNLTLIKQKKI